MDPSWERPFNQVPNRPVTGSSRCRLWFGWQGIFTKLQLQSSLKNIRFFTMNQLMGKKIVGLGTLMISSQSQQTLVGKQSNTNFNLITTSFICDYKRVPFSNNRFHFRVSNQNPNHRDPNQPTLTIRSFRHTPGTYPPRPPTGMPDIMLQGYVGVLLDH